MEKNFFMVWIGGDVPKWASHTFTAFKETNPSFACEFIIVDPQNYSEWDSRLTNYYVKGCTPYSECKKQLDTVVGRVHLSELIRYYLVQTFGGIIADCDVWPIRPFDESLIKLEKPFKITKTKPPNLNFISDDIFFMGGPRGCDLQNNPRLLYPIKFYDYNDECFNALRKKFFDCVLTIGEHYNNPDIAYVDHFDANSYRRHKQESN